MKFNKAAFISQILSSGKRKAIPIMTSPGIELIGAKPRDVFQDGELQFKCIKALVAECPADMHVTFMDLSIEAEAFGSSITYSDHENPTVSAPLASDAGAIAALKVPAVGTKRTAEVIKCAKLCAENLERPTLCGIIGPYSLAGRLADMTEMMMLAAGEPETAHALLAKTTEFLTGYLKALKATGVAGVLIAEPAAGLLSPDMCQEFAADYVRKIIAGVKDESFMVVLHNCGKTEKQVDALRSTGADAIHVGNAVDILDILPQVPADYPVMGNLDPVNVFKTMDTDSVYRKTAELLERTSGYRNYVLSSGCDLPPAVPIANVKAFFRALNDYNNHIGE